MDLSKILLFWILCINKIWERLVESKYFEVKVFKVYEKNIIEPKVSSII